ncbi:MAG: Valine--tRNA ligase [Alphaproteobacteria bacterium MarineAlpha5_Bin7]|nr:MAG: Valine--tRNA ligase [Alphaproteobacteria bacterium MarineAlpha5_Bin7]
MILSKEFDFLNQEKKIYNKWEDLGSFKPIKNKTPYCIMMPPPNVTGSLHMGHALTFTIQDILIRYNRMLGKEVLWQAGTDHAGIATQMVVERQLKKEGINKNDIGREKFISKVWNWKNESGNTINNQLRRLGASADWSRERFTMDEGLSTAVKKAFADLYNNNLIYKDKRLVNWDSKLLTAISDLEVEQREQEGFLWHIKYPLNNDKYIIVATTRPETIFGDSAVAVHPGDNRYKEFIGLECSLPLTKRKVKIISDEYADPEKGTGAVKITPAHDFNDFEVGKRNKLEFINIFDKFAKLNENVPIKYRKLDRFEARKLILEDLKSLNLLIKEEKQMMVVPYGDRSGVIIEPWLTDQWFCDAKKLSIDPINAVKNGDTKFVPKQWEKTFFNWMENIEPWCISRQLWWGHQIPAWYCPNNKCFVATSKDEAQKQAKDLYGKDVKLVQDEDVLDTWFSSALWTFSTLDWPKNTYELNKFYPGNVLVTGFDIIFFWVARMMMMGSYFMKKTPFNDVYIHPLIRDEFGQKMSKSKGNIIDPLDLLDKYGADTLRFTLTALLNPGRDVKLSESRIKGYKSFTNKIWNAANFLKMNEAEFNIDFNYKEILLPTNQWIVNELIKVSNLIDKFMEKYLFHEIANILYHFIWHIFCDWYIEFTKSYFKDADKSVETKKVSGWVFGQILLISHPIIPFITEEIWNKLFNAKKLLMLQKFSKFNNIESYNKSQKNIDFIINIITSVRNIRSELNIPYKKTINLYIENKNNEKNDIINNFNNEIKRLLKIDKIFYKLLDKKEKSAFIIIADTTLSIPLEGIIDTTKEINRIIEKMDKEKEKLLKIKNKLENKKFLENAPSNVIESFKKDAINLESSIEKTNQIINTIK